MTEANPQRAQRLIRLPEVTSMTGLSKGSVYRGVRDGSFPQPIRLTKASVGWVEAEVQTWVDQRIEEHRQAAAG